MKEKIRFRNLSGWLKTAIIGGWIALVVGILEFFIGFLEGILGI